jgi:hypothetical protein
MGKLLLIFDGFDEMADRVDSQKMINNFWELARVVVPGSKAILSCRSEHCPEAQEGRALLNAELKASTSALTGEPPQFEVLELEKFNDEQIRQVLSFRAGDCTVEQIMKNPQLLDLARRPVMTELILEALPEIEAGKPIDMSRVYLYAVRTKMERDIKAERTFTSLADKLYFMCELSWEMLSTDQMSLNYRLFPDRLRRLFGHAVEEQKHLDHWHYDMMGQTMLIRNADGDYMPAHRSLLEFFVAYKFAAELGVLASDFIELAKAQTHVDESFSSTYTWSSYFYRQRDDKGNIQYVSPLQEFIPEKMDLLSRTIGKEPLSTNNKISRQGQTSAVLKLIRNMLSPNKEKVSTRLLTLIKETTNKTLEEAGYAGGNIATILVQYDIKALANKNLDGANLIQADFSFADLTECNLNHTNLTNAIFNLKSILINTKLQGSNLAGVRLSEIIGRIAGLFLNPRPPIGTYNELDSEDKKNLSMICFYYPDDDEDFLFGHNIALPFTVGSEEVVVAFKDRQVFKWVYRIKTSSILNSKVEDGMVLILTTEGEEFRINIKTGQLLPVEDLSPLRNWFGADLSNVAGLEEYDVPILKVLGARNLPDISCDPHNEG